jgi:CRP/FNR family transcriptional regulator
MHTISNGANSRGAANGRYQTGAGRGRLSSRPPLVSNVLVSASVSARFECHRHIVGLMMALVAKNRGRMQNISEFSGAPWHATPQGGPSRYCPGDEPKQLPRVRGELTLGQRQLNTIFGNSPPRTLKAGEILGATTGSSDAIWRLRTGWACQFHDFTNGGRAIVDVYLPGDVLGLDAIFGTRPLDQISTLSTVTIETIPAAAAMSELMASRPTALYVAWLLSRRQRRADRLLAALCCLDARGRLATMMLDFYTRLRRRRLIAGSVYSLPLTQTNIGDYLGLTVVHISRVLRRLRDARIVTLEKHCVTIHDLELLTRLAENAETVNSSTTIGERSFTKMVLPAERQPFPTVNLGQSGYSQLAGFPVGAGRTGNLTRATSPSVETTVRANAADHAVGYTASDVHDVSTIICTNS